MEPSDARLQEMFFAVFEPLPRQGPGSRACTERALALCDRLAEAPRILDLGCGAGAQTMDLVELTYGSVVAVDSHAPNIERLRAAVTERGLHDRIEPWVGDMRTTGLPPASFDLIWSEGALYNIGVPAALVLCAGLLRPGGFVAFTEPVWLTDERPAEVRSAFAQYPAMGSSADVERQVAASDLTMQGHFTLPAEAWWDDFYAPMEQRLAALRERHAGDDEALAALEIIAREPAMHRRHGVCYGYEFFVLRR